MAAWVGFFVVVRRRRNAYLNGGSILVLAICFFTTYRHYGWAGVALVPPGGVLMGLLVALYLKARGRPWREKRDRIVGDR
jgi:hypothetical protein